MALSTPTRDPELEDGVFDASSYDLPIPAQHGLRAQEIRLRWIGVIDLDRTNIEHLELVQALRLGSPVRAVVVGSVSGTGFTHRPGAGSRDDDVVGYYASVRIDDVELGEPA